MTVLPGNSLGGEELSEPQLSAIMVALDRLHTSVPSSALADLPLCPQGAAGGLAGQLAKQPRPIDDVVIGRAYDESLRWLGGAEAHRLAVEESAVPVLGRADHNLSNFLWNGQDVGLVDFEYAGRSDAPNEIADLVEHISARCTPDGLWEQFLDGSDLSRAERGRLRAARRVRVAMWFLLLLPGQSGEKRNPPGALRKQAERVLALLGA
jgi:thiamine kinase-like enzyme